MIDLSGRGLRSFKSCGISVSSRTKVRSGTSTLVLKFANTRSLGLLTVLFLSACNPYEEKFDCPVGRGEKCASLGTVNTLANEGKYAPLPKKKTSKAHVFYPGTTKRMES